MTTTKPARQILLLEPDKVLASEIAKAFDQICNKFYVCSDVDTFSKHVSSKDLDIIIISLYSESQPLASMEAMKRLIIDVTIKAKLIIYYNDGKNPWINEIYKVASTLTITDFIPFSINQLVQQANTALLIKKHEDEYIKSSLSKFVLKRRLFQSNPFIGESESIKKARAMICKLAIADEDMFIIGETGTGKEVAAYYYYFNSKRFGKPYNTVNCSALTETLIESELFGHIKGSFTDADRNKIGLFELSSKGVLFLDELTNLSLAAQSKLLRAIENKEIQIVGGESRRVDTKLIFASNAGIKRLSHPEVVRKDLFYRIEGNIVELAPLRERGEDVFLILNYFLNRYASDHHYVDYYGIVDVKQDLMSYSWPGNVRELKSFCKLLLINEHMINAKTLRSFLYKKKLINKDYYDPGSDFLKDTNFKSATASFESAYLKHQLETYNWQISKTAEVIGLERTTLYKKMKQLNIKQPRS